MQESSFAFVSEIQKCPPTLTPKALCRSAVSTFCCVGVQ
jgi:hypothetical protein